MQGKTFNRRHFDKIVFLILAFHAICLLRNCLLPKETICMKCQGLFHEKIKQNMNNMSSAEFAQRVVKIIINIAEDRLYTVKQTTK